MPAIIQEGLKTYCVGSSDYTDYFYDVEYRTIRDNFISVLVPVQIREKDNQTEVYYDISGKRSLETCAQDQAFSFSQCRTIAKELLRMMEEIEEFLLEPDYICFEPAFVYMSGRKLFWLYGISHNRSIQEELEDFLSFLLSKLDYDDQEAVHFAYQLFWLVRKQGFSKELVEDLLKENPGGDGCPEGGSDDRYRAFFAGHPSELLSPKSPEKEAGFLPDSLTEDRLEGGVVGRERSKGTRSLPPALIMALSGILFVLSVTGGGILLFFGWEKGLTETGMVILGACGIGALVSAFVAAGKLKKILIVQSDSDSFEPDEELIGQDWGREEKAAAQDFLTEEEERLSGIGKNRNTGFAHREEEGTIILSKIRRNCPMLKSMEDDSLTIVRDLPFYIGSDPVLNQLVLIDKTISRQHAVILQGKKNSWKIKDLGSTNGTWIKGVRVNSDQPDRLEDGAIISFAQKKYRFILNRDPV